MTYAGFSLLNSTPLYVVLRVCHFWASFDPLTYALYYVHSPLLGISLLEAVAALETKLHCYLHIDQTWLASCLKETPLALRESALNMRCGYLQGDFGMSISKAKLSAPPCPPGPPPPFMTAAL